MDDREIYRQFLVDNQIDFDPLFDRITFRHATESDKILKAAARRVVDHNEELAAKRKRDLEIEIPYYADAPFRDD
jgi:hypothetical protein